MQGTMPGARRRGRPRKAWMDNVNTWTGLSVEESVRMTEDRDKWRKYDHGRDAECLFFVGLRLWILKKLGLRLQLRRCARIQTPGTSAPTPHPWPQLNCMDPNLID